MTLGTTLSGEPVHASLSEIVQAHSLVTGGTGAGKSMFALLIIKALIEAAARGSPLGFGVLDPKGDLFVGTLFLLKQQMAELAGNNPKAARDLRRRVVIYDFSARDPVSPFNILARWPNAEPDFFAWNRADLLLDLLPGSDKLSLSGVADRMLLSVSKRFCGGLNSVRRDQL